MRGSGLLVFENGERQNVWAVVRPDLLTKMLVAETEIQAFARIHWRVETVQYEQEMRNATMEVMAQTRPQDRASRNARQSP